MRTMPLSRENTKTETKKVYSIINNGDGTITVVFKRPLLLTMDILLSLLFDGTSFYYRKRRRQCYLLSLNNIHPQQWQQYKQEWGMN